MRFKPARRNGLRVQIPPDALFLRIVQGTEYQATNREPQVRFLLWRLMSEWRNGRRGILKISFLRVRIPLPTLCRCIRKAQEPALEAGGEQLAGSNPAPVLQKKRETIPLFLMFSTMYGKPVFDVIVYTDLVAIFFGKLKIGGCPTAFPSQKASAPRFGKWEINRCICSFRTGPAFLPRLSQSASMTIRWWLCSLA